MGIVFQKNERFINMAKDQGGFKANPAVLPEVTVVPNNYTPTIDQAAFSAKEVERLLKDIDAMADETQNLAVAEILAKRFPVILAQARWAKVKGTAEYGGQKATGRQLVATWLRPPHMGDSNITNNANTATSGLYGGTNNSVYSWLPSTQWTAGTAKTIFPSQTMTDSAALSVFGYIEMMQIPGVDGYRFTLSGNNTPVLPLKFNIGKRYSEVDGLVAELLEPVLIGPLQLFAHDLYPGRTQDSAPECLGILVARAEVLTR